MFPGLLKPFAAMPAGLQKHIRYPEDLFLIQAREALDHYTRAMERLKSGDWAGFGTELDAMRGLLEDISRQSGGH